MERNDVGERVLMFGGDTEQDQGVNDKFMLDFYFRLNYTIIVEIGDSSPG